MIRSDVSHVSSVYESSGKLEQHLLHTDSGYVHHQLGLFDACLSVQSDDISFIGQYCTVFFDLKPPSQNRESEPYDYMSNFRMPSVSFCIPSTCNARDFRSAVAQLLNGHRIVNGRNLSIVAVTNEDYCYNRNKTNDSKFDSLSIFTLYGVAFVKYRDMKCNSNYSLVRFFAC